ncbi:MAG: hypothetical protein IIA67_00595 [Planctomycetes bacterium]|nr:hypothetical protein [Planctomycetota bacterium]
MKKDRQHKLPKRPSLVGAQDEVADRIWDWFLRLQESLLAADADSDGEHLHRLEVEIESLIALARKNLDSKVHTYNLDDDELKAGWMAGFHSLLGHCLRRQNKRDAALAAYDQALLLAPWNMHHIEAYVDLCLDGGYYERATRCVNQVPLKYLKTEDDSTARLMLKWACDNPAFASDVQARFLKKCIELISLHGGLQSANAKHGGEGEKGDKSN